MKRPDTTWERLWRYRGVVLILLVPVLLISAVCFLLPSHSLRRSDPHNSLQQLQSHGARYAVVFDAGSTGSRVHVFKFQLEDGELKLLSDTFEQLKPGLSSYADDPEKAAASLLPLLSTALKTVPDNLKADTPVSLKATAGLRLLPGDKADNILQAVTALLKTSGFKMSADAVSIMDGKDEGAFAWLTLNYLLGKLGGSHADTVSAIDLGGGSVQEAFAMSPEEAANAPEGLITNLRGGGKTYQVYVYSYLGYGLMAARAKAIEAALSNQQGNPCYHKGALAMYQYAGKEYAITPANSGAAFAQCSTVHVAAMNTDKDCSAPQEQCTFNGVWHGKRPASTTYYVSSYLWDRAFDTGIIAEEDAITWATKPQEFAAKAKDVCSKASLELISSAYSRVKADAAGFLCADLTYCAQLLTSGFKLGLDKDITLVKQINYNGQKIEAAWPLGAAVNDLSSD